MSQRRPAQAVDLLTTPARCRSEPSRPDPSLLDIYTRLLEMATQIAVIYEQLKVIADHENRIRILEASRAKFVGACLAVSAIAGWGAGWLALAFSHH